MNITELNIEINKLEDKGQISDGYHTFEELYDHRCLLYLALCIKYKDYCYYTYTNSDGSTWDGWFLLVLNHPDIKQISYHLPIELVDYCSLVDIKFKDKSDDYDGHSSKNVVDGLQDLIELEIINYINTLPKPKKPELKKVEGAALAIGKTLDGRSITKEMIESWNK
jgi:hypothetical protein